MTQNDWWKNWLKPSNLIALGALVVAAIGVFGGITIFTNRQVIKGTDGCTVTNSDWELSGNGSSAQIVDCSGGATMDNNKIKN